MNIYTVEVGEQTYLMCTCDLELLISEHPLRLEELVSELIGEDLLPQLSYEEIHGMNEMVRGFYPKIHTLDSKVSDELDNLFEDSSKAHVIKRKETGQILLAFIPCADSRIRSTGEFLGQRMTKEKDGLFKNIQEFSHPFKSLESNVPYCEATLH